MSYCNVAWIFHTGLTFCLENYLKKLIGNTEIEDCLQKLDKLTQEEARMALAEQLKVAHDIDGKVTSVDDRVQGIGTDISSGFRRVDYKLDQANRSLSL